MSVLNALSGRTANQPQDWWDWWDKQIGNDRPQKSLVEVEERQLKATETAITVVRGHSCFAASTLIYTDLGLLPIEEIRMGDRVLSQCSETGEVEFKTVESTTVRPKMGPRIKLRIGDDTITCTPGHEIWQNGIGWVRAKELKRGDMVRTLTGSAKVKSVEEGPQLVTYNLVVEGNHTYFAGESGFLVQDVTTAAPTDNVVPGLSRFDLEEGE